MKLSKRLTSLFDCIEQDAVVADIGCDHAQLCCSLIISNKCHKVYACDVNEGPLQQAKKNIILYQLQDHIHLLLSDGLEKIPDDVDTIVIAGMGFETIQMILENNLEKLANRRIIVQCNRDVEGLRKWISNHHYKIMEEKTVYDEHYYQIVVFITEQSNILTSEEIYFGNAMIKDDTFYSMWKLRLYKYEQILSNLDKNSKKFKEIQHLMLLVYKEFALSKEYNIE